MPDADDPWDAQREAFGAFIRSQRRLADMSLREMAERTKVSNAYLSQIERGLHAPSVRILRSIARALDLSTEAMLAQAGLLEDQPVTGTGTGTGDPSGTGEPSGTGGPSGTEVAIRSDRQLTQDQKEALLSVYRSYVAGDRSPDRA